MNSQLFSPFKLRDLLLDNRIVVSPMCQYSAENGSATDWHLMHIGQFAVSGVGLVILEAAHVEPRGRITHGCLGLYSDDNEQALKRVVDFCHKHSEAAIGIQLSHAGRKGSASLPWIKRGTALTEAQNAWQTIAPSSVAQTPEWPSPQPMTAADFDTVREAHVQAVVRAARIGIDLIEVNIAHGYLLHSFLSPLANRRTDQFGGSIENRMRYPLEVFAAMRKAWPAQRPMGARITATDWIEGGWTIEDAKIFSNRLKELGCDFITASSGGTSAQQQVPLYPGHQVEFAADIRKVVSVPTMAVGMLYDPQQAEDIIASGSADFVALARGMLFDPHWVWYAASVLHAQVKHPVQYLRGYRSEWLRQMRRGDQTP